MDSPTGGVPTADNGRHAPLINRVPFTNPDSEKMRVGQSCENAANAPSDSEKMRVGQSCENAANAPSELTANIDI